MSFRIMLCALMEPEHKLINTLVDSGSWYHGNIGEILGYETESGEDQYGFLELDTHILGHKDGYEFLGKYGERYLSRKLVKGMGFSIGGFLLDQGWCVEEIMTLRSDGCWFSLDVITDKMDEVTHIRRIEDWEDPDTHILIVKTERYGTEDPMSHAFIVTPKEYERIINKYQHELTTRVMFYRKAMTFKLPDYGDEFHNDLLGLNSGICFTNDNFCKLKQTLVDAIKSDKVMSEFKELLDFEELPEGWVLVIEEDI